MNLTSKIRNLYCVTIKSIVNSYVPLIPEVFYTEDYIIVDEPPEDKLFISGNDLLLYINFFQNQVFPVDLDVYSLTEETLLELTDNKFLSLTLIRELKLQFTSTVSDYIH